VRLYRLTLDAPARNTQPRYNICPTTNIDTVIERHGQRELMPMRWGLVPSWWSKPLKEMKVATFNARAETVADKPVFRDAFRRTRCLIPASGYYEWQDTSNGKQPFYFTRRDGQPITFAGLWDAWRDEGEDASDEFFDPTRSPGQQRPNRSAAVPHRARASPDSSWLANG
jgi:putative SOS response-associated peptidase YedK